MSRVIAFASTGPAAEVPVGDGDGVVPVCPLCHTIDDTVSVESLRTGAWWRCTVCHQSWSATRLTTVKAYDAFAARQTIPRTGLRITASPS